MPDLIELHQPFATADFAPKSILSGEFAHAKPSLRTLGIRFRSLREETDKSRETEEAPYFACCYNVGNLGDVNVVAFYHPPIC